jgi:hypothetical protein
VVAEAEGLLTTPPADQPPDEAEQFFRITFLRTASWLGTLAGTVVVEADVGVELGVDVEAPIVDVVVVAFAEAADVVVVAFAAAAVDVVVPELDFAGDGEEQPARMPAAPSTHRTRTARRRVNIVMSPCSSSRSHSG